MMEEDNAPLDVEKEEPEGADLLKEVCEMNGINFGKIFLNAVDDVTKIEVLFSPFSKIPSLKVFTNLTSLHILKCDVKSFDGVQYLHKLQELFVIECYVQSIDHFDNCLDLKSLFLYDNKISKIEGLNGLKSLETLWLNSNNISTIEGLNELKQLRNLNLADNKISKIGQSLDHLTNLQHVDLSNNLLSCLRDLTNLAALPQLRSLSLKDPVNGPNPVCLLCNCTTHILYHMPSLTHLDTQAVTDESVREVESIVLKKKMYYNMRVKTVRRNMSDLLKLLQDEKKSAQLFSVQKLNRLSKVVKSIERDLIEQGEGDYEQLENLASSSQGSQYCKDLKGKLVDIKARVVRWTNHINLLDNQCAEFQNRIKSVAESSIIRLTTELESGGNVRFEDGVSSDSWFTSCRDLVMSRFCASSLRQFDIQAIKIQRITRLHNRMLRLKFDEKLDTLVDETQSRSSNQYKKKFEYLFYTWNPTIDKQCKDNMTLLEHGLPPASFYSANNCPGAVPLTNSVSIADKLRLSSFSKVSMKRLCDQVDATYGQLLVCKVYLGKAVLAQDVSNLNRDTLPNVDSVFNPLASSSTSSLIGNGDMQKQKSEFLNGENNGCEQNNSECVNTAAENKEMGCSAPSSGATSNIKGCDCINRQCNWFIFDHELVVPEYIVDYQYSFRSKPTSPFMSLPDGINGTSSAIVSLNDKSHVKIEEEKEDVGLLESAESLLKKRLRLVTISEDMLLKVTGESSLTNLVVLNLHNCGINRAKSLPQLPALKKLIVTFNDLVRLEDFGKIPTLEYLDASFNKLNTLEGLKNLLNLKFFDISWNELCNTRDDVAILRKHAPNIVHLNLSRNPWRKAENIRIRVIGRLKSLKTLNGFPITDSENIAASRAAASARISPTSMISNGRTDSHRPRSLSLSPYAEILYLKSKKKPQRLTELDSSWLANITCLYIDSQHLSKISNLDRLENLKFASFRDNDITKIEGLDSCTNLEELSLDYNCIAKIEGLSKLNKLKRLSVNNNVVTALDSSSIDSLTSLYYLSLENNSVTSLTPLQNVTTLMELYIGNNEIANIREIFNLKNFPNLVILDLFGNPMANGDANNYRLFVVYHLKSLKALDGSAISNSDLNQAREFFGGKLTLDFVADKLRVNDFTQVKEMDFPNSSLRHVDLGNTNLFCNLRSLNLEHNSLTSFSGLIYLENLQVLCLNYNKIDCIIDSKTSKASRLGTGAGENQYGSIESMRFILPKLEVLHLGYNSISDISSLQLDRISSIKSLFLQGNEITEIDGLHSLTNLRDLVLDRNKIKGISPTSFVRNDRLIELHLEENRLRELTNIHYLVSLQRLFLANNRIQDMAELDRLESLGSLVEVNLTNNAISRRLLHRPVLVFRQPNLEIIDGIAVSDEERQKADMYFMDQQPTQNQNNGLGVMPQIQMTENVLPGIKSSATNNPMKVTSVQLGANIAGYHFGLDDTAIGGGGRNKQHRNQPPHHTQLLTTTNHGGGSGQRPLNGNVNMTTNARLYRRFFQTPPK